MVRTEIKRDRSIDLLKSLAIFGVITIHICTSGTYNPILSADWISSVFWGSLVRGSVPIFLMCSGALLLNPEKPLTIRKLYTKNLLKIVLALFFWAAFYKAYHLIMNGTTTLSDWITAIKETVLFRHEFHLYYLHIILFVYAFLPISRKFIVNASKNELLYALLIWFLTGILYPSVRSFWPFSLLSGVPAQWMMNMTYASIGYGILGYYLKKYPISVSASCIAGGIGLMVTFGGTLAVSVGGGHSIQDSGKECRSVRCFWLSESLACA